MHNYLLTLIAFLLFLLLIILYFLYKNLNNMKVQVAKNTSNINQLASALDIFATSHEQDILHQEGGTQRSVEQHPVPTMPESHVLDTIPENIEDENRFELSEEDLETCSSEEEVDEVDLQNKVDDILNSLEGDEGGEDGEEEGEEETDVKVISTPEKEKKNKRKVPNKPAKSFDEGYTMTSENDGNNYQVFLTSNGQHRWKLVQQEPDVEKSLVNFMKLDEEVEEEDAGEEEVEEKEEKEDAVEEEEEDAGEEDEVEEDAGEEDEGEEDTGEEDEVDDNTSLEIVDALSSDEEDEEDEE